MHRSNHTSFVKRATRAAVLAVAALAASGCPFGGGSADPAEQVTAFAVRVDGGSPAVTVAYGDPDEFDVGLPAGDYYVIAVNGDNAVLDGGIVQVEEDASFAFTKFTGEADGRSAALGALASFLTDAELLRLDLLEATSAGFTAPLFSADVDVDSSAFERFYSGALALAEREAEVIAAVQDAGSGQQTAAKLSAPVAGVMDRLAEKLLPDFFNRMRTLGERERTRVNAIIAEITPADQKVIFDEMPISLRGGASSFEQWHRQVQSGEMDDQMGAIHGYLYAVAGDAASASGHTLGRSMAEEGAPLVESGTDLLVKAYGRVPHVGKAIEVTKKAREWEAYARKLYKDPEGGVNDLLRGPYQKFVKDRIKGDLRKSMPDAPEKVIDALAAQLSKQIVGVLATRPAAVVGQDASGASPGAPPASGIETPEGSNWIEEVVAEVAQRLLDEGHSGIEVAVVTDDLRICLAIADAAGQSRAAALAACAYTFENAETPVPGECDGENCEAPTEPAEEPPTAVPPTVAPPQPTAPPAPPPATPEPMPTCASFDPTCSLGRR
jgi:hypothetical protein